MFIEPIDGFNLIDFLNEQSSKGWILEKASSYHLKFIYQPSIRLYYSITDNELHSTFVSRLNIEKDKKLNDLAEEFDYNLVYRGNEFSIYSSTSEVPMYSDEDSTRGFIKRLSKKQILFDLIRLIYIALLSVFMIVSGDLLIGLSDNLIVFTFLILYPILIIWSISRFIRSIRFYKGKIRWKDSKWKSMSHDYGHYSIMFLLLVLMLFMFLRAAGNLHLGLSLVLIMVLLGLGFFSYWYINEQNWAPRIKLVTLSVFCLVLFLVFTFIATNMTRDSGVLPNTYEHREILKLDDLMCTSSFNEESIVLKLSYMTCGESYLKVVEPKIDLLKPLIRNLFVENSDIHYTLNEGFSDENYDYIIGENYLLKSMDKIPQELINYYKNK